MSIYRILVVEDQESTLESLFDALRITMPEFFPKNVISFAKWYEVAEEMIAEESYDLVLLDHRMPYSDPKCTDRDDSFSRKCRNIGYNLIPAIREKNPKALIIGTSSLDKDELDEFPVPDCKMSKMYRDAANDLRQILEGARAHL